MGSRKFIKKIALKMSAFLVGQPQPKQLPTEVMSK
jgi:hypothetical protein